MTNGNIINKTKVNIVLIRMNACLDTDSKTVDLNTLIKYIIITTEAIILQ